jgi:hypothetical protein
MNDSEAVEFNTARLLIYHNVYDMNPSAKEKSLSGSKSRETMYKTENLFSFDTGWRIIGSIRGTVREFVTGIDVSGDQGLVKA